jgi:8-oxo-dGTP diphosphatase
MKAVIGIVFNSDKSKVLLIKRRDVPVWVFPGGGVEVTETAEEAVVREVFEETGLHVSIVRKIGEYTPINRLSKFTETFECIPLQGELQTGAETKDIAFYPLHQLPKSFFPVHQDWLQDTLEYKAIIIQKPISRVTYFALFKYFLSHPLHVIRFALSLAGLPINT